MHAVALTPSPMRELKSFIFLIPFAHGLYIHSNEGACVTGCFFKKDFQFACRREFGIGEFKCAFINVRRDVTNMMNLKSHIYLSSVSKLELSSSREDKKKIF